MEFHDLRRDLGGKGSQCRADRRVQCRAYRLSGTQDELDHRVGKTFQMGTEFRVQQTAKLRRLLAGQPSPEFVPIH